MSTPHQDSSKTSPCSPSISDKVLLLTWLQTKMQQFGQFLSRILPNCYEPQVWQNFDRHGNSSGWQVFDPVTGRTTAFGSDLEVRLWLDQQFYH